MAFLGGGVIGVIAPLMGDFVYVIRILIDYNCLFFFNRRLDNFLTVTLCFSNKRGVVS